MKLTHMRQCKESLPILLLMLFCSVSTRVHSQTSNSISSIDFVKIKNGQRKEAIFYYENNWKVFRERALQKRYIKSFKMLTTNADSIGNFDIILITEYADSLQLKLSEERFGEIIKSRTSGAKFLNSSRPNEFRENVFSKQALMQFSSECKVP